MNKQKKNDKQKVKNLQDAIERKMAQERKFLVKTYILDDENAIAISYLPMSDDNRRFIMTHYQMSYGKLYNITTYRMRGSHGKHLKKYKLFLIMKDNYDYENHCIAIYDYQQEKFIVETDTFDNIGYDSSMSIIDQCTPRIDYLKQHNCFFAYFTLVSNNKLGDDGVQYKCSINGSYYWYDFGLPTETYFAFVNLDGTIRGNSLFNGDDITKIEQIINLGPYGSLEAFKIQRRNELNEIIRQNKKAYYDKVGTGDFENPSPYMDQEVIKVMTLSK